jgi:hypothetical protein
MMLGVLAVTLGAWQFLPVNSTIEGERLILRDARHFSRAEMLTTSDGGVMIRLNNIYGKARSIWELDPKGAVSLRLTDAGGTNRAELRLEDSGSPSLAMTGPDGHTRTWLGTADDGTSPRLILRNADGIAFWNAPATTH